jgi:hypothetical protein
MIEVLCNFCCECIEQYCVGVRCCMGNRFGEYGTGVSRNFIDPPPPKSWAAVMVVVVLVLTFLGSAYRLAGEQIPVVALGPTQPPIQWVPVPFPGGKEAGAWH